MKLCINWKFLALAIILLILVIILAVNAAAFTTTTHQYIAVKSFPNQICKDELIRGSALPLDSTRWADNPDFFPNNKKCPNADQYCQPILLAQKYKQQAKQETDSCKNALQKGIATYYIAEAANPTNWKEYDEVCKTEFNQEIEKKIIEQQPFQTTKQCTADGNTQTLTFSNIDLENIITNIQGFYEYEQAPIEDLNQLKATAQELVNITKTMTTEGQPQTDKEIEFTTKMLMNLTKYGCFETTEKLNDYYEAYKTLDPTAKQCLKIFLTGGQTQPYLFMTQCTGLGGAYTQQNPTAYGQTAYYAQYALEQYLTTGFAERECQQYNPNTMQTLSPIETTTQATIPVCYYNPKKLAGCTEYFEQREKKETEAYETGTANTLITITLAGLLGFIAFFTYWTKG